MLSIALKEWSVVCDLLLAGRLVFLLRKGGIHEPSGPGVFELEHRRFLLFPSWLHQKPDMLKPEYAALCTTFGSEPTTLAIRGLAEATHIWPIRDRSLLQPGGSLDDLHPWAPAQIDMRFDYKPHNPLYLVALRVHRLLHPRTLHASPEYAGCRSWVPLRPEHHTEDLPAAPALSEHEYLSRLHRIGAALGDSTREQG